MRGVWERQIRATRSILSTLMEQNGHQLDNEGLRTLLIEAAAIINGRPFTVNGLSDPTILGPLNPNMILTMKSKVILPPPG